MWIIDHERGEIVNTDNVISLYKEDDMVKAFTQPRDILLGRYESNERAREVFNALVCALAYDTYIMPEK